VERPARPVVNERGERLLACHRARAPALPVRAHFALALIGICMSCWCAAPAAASGSFPAGGSNRGSRRATARCANCRKKRATAAPACRCGRIVIGSGQAGPTRMLTGAVFAAEVDGPDGGGAGR